MPQGYGILPDEWEAGLYPDKEPLRVGARGMALNVNLPIAIWYPRAIRWVQGLDILIRMLNAPQV